MADIISVAEKLNSEVHRLNNERSKLEGMLESARTNYEKAIKAYEVKYGVKLTEENLQAEYNNVFAKTKGSVLDLQEKIDSINRGDYKKEDTAPKFDLEPDVEPIRAIIEQSEEDTTVEDVVENAEETVKEEVKEPEKKKRGRKPKAAPVSTIEAEDIGDVEPVIEAGPLDLSLDFNTMGDETVVSSPVTETPVVEEPKKETKKKPIVDDLDALLEQADTAIQKPVTLGVEDEESDDEVSLESLGLDTSFGTNPMGIETEDEVEDTDEVSFGGFGDLAGFGGLEETTTETPVAPVTEEKSEIEDATADFGDFGGFGGFGGFGDLEETTTAPKTEVKEEKKEVTPETPDGWGSDVGFNFGVDFDSILNSTDIKFGE